METETLVYVDLSGKPYLVGRLWTRTRKEKDSATFEYDKDWLVNPLHFSLEPALTLGPGPFHSGDRAWRSIATELGLSASQVDRMASAFEHAEIQKALAGKPIISSKAASKGKRKLSAR